MNISFNTGTCAECAGPINKGDKFQWGRERGARVCVKCFAGEIVKKASQPEPVWSRYQTGFYSEVENSRDNLMLIAVAGSGKTRSIEKACTLISEDLYSTYLVFNKGNAEEAKLKMPDHVNASTFHSACLTHLKRRLHNPKIDGNKVRRLFGDMVFEGAVTEREAEDFGPAIQKLIGLAKAEGIDAITPDTDEIWWHLIDHFDVTLDVDPESYVPGYDPYARSIEISRKLLDLSNESLDVIDFDDMLYLTVKLHVALPRQDVIFVDEAQDTNKIQRALLRMMLKLDGRLIAVGDPRQAIYGFRGADSAAMDKIQEEFGCRKLPLSINYRCSRAVIEYAKAYCPELEACETAPEGSVEELANFNPREFRSTDAVLCRTTAPLISLAYKLIGLRIPCKVKGREIGEGLKNLVKKLQGRRKQPLTIAQLEDKLEAYRAREVAKWTAKGEDSKAEAAQDRVESLFAAIDALSESDRTLNGLLESLDSLFANDIQDQLTLATVHKSKGLEWERVFILDRDLMPSRWARQSWQKDQEQNLIYVAATRAKVDLFFLPSKEILTKAELRLVS